jgi:hypothetical protein
MKRACYPRTRKPLIAIRFASREIWWPRAELNYLGRFYDPLRVPRNLVAKGGMS